MIYKTVEYLKLTYLILVKYHHNIKLQSNIRTLFQFVDDRKLTDNRTYIILKMIKKAIIALDMGLKDPDAIFTYSLDDSNEDVEDLRSRLLAPIKQDLVDMMAKLYSTYIMYKPLLERSDLIIELFTSIKATGVASAIENVEKIGKVLEVIKEEMSAISIGKIHEELIIDDKREIGLEKLLKDRETENSFILKINPALDALFGGGLKARKTYLVSALTGHFKSGFLLNIGCYAKDNAVIDETFLEGKIPAILYITHENTIIQTTNRILSFYGYKKKEIKAMSSEEYSIALRQALKPKKNGVRLIIRYYDPKTISVKDIKNMVYDLSSAGMKTILILEDYVKHLTCALTEDEKIEKKQSGDKIAEEISALSREIFAPIMTAAQLNRTGEITYAEVKKKYVDYLKFLNKSHLAGSYNAAASYENICFIDRGFIEANKKEYFCIYVSKDRDADNNMGSGEYSEFTDYMVLPFKDDVGFRLDDTKCFKSINDLNPNASRQLQDAFNNMARELEEQKQRDEVLRKAQLYLLDNGFNEDELDVMTSEDIIQKAAHISGEKNEPPITKK